jgi:hypothetical protein
MTTRNGRLAPVIGATLLAFALAACGASGGGDSADTTVKKTATTEKTTTTEKKTTTEPEEDETTTTEPGESGDQEVTEEYSDDFEDDDNADNWDVGSDAKGAVGIEDGSYYTDIAPGKQFFLASDGFRDWDSAAVAIKTTVQKWGQGNPVAAIACLAQTDDEGTLNAWYDLGVSAEGRASIYKYTSDAEPVELLEPTDIEGYDRETPFVLEMACITREDGSVGMAIVVDGETVGSALDEDDPLGSGALKVETIGDEENLSAVYFDDWQMLRYD